MAAIAGLKIYEVRQGFTYALDLVFPGAICLSRRPQGHDRFRGGPLKRFPETFLACQQ